MILSYIHLVSGRPDYYLRNSNIRGKDHLVEYVSTINANDVLD